MAFASSARGWGCIFVAAKNGIQFRDDRGGRLGAGLSEGRVGPNRRSGEQFQDGLIWRSDSVVRAEGLEPSRGSRPNGFSYHLRLSPRCPRARPGGAPAGLWSGLYLHRNRSVRCRSAVGAARLVSTPSPPEFSVGAWLGIAISQGSPNLSSSALPVSRRALKLRLSPVRLPISPRPHGQLKYKARCRCEVLSPPPWLPSSCA